MCWDGTGKRDSLLWAYSKERSKSTIDNCPWNPNLVIVLSFMGSYRIRFLLGNCSLK